MTVILGVNYLVIIVAAVAAVVMGTIYSEILGVGDRQRRTLGANPTEQVVLAGGVFGLGEIASRTYWTANAPDRNRRVSSCRSICRARIGL